jgi:Protein of unknown function (DUF4031)
LFDSVAKGKGGRLQNVETQVRVLPLSPSFRRDVRILYDDQRHLIAVPYTVENLHKAAQQLGIKRCWFHKDHYDIPKRMVARMSETVAEKVSPREIVKIVRGK